MNFEDSLVLGKFGSKLGEVFTDLCDLSKELNMKINFKVQDEMITSNLLGSRLHGFAFPALLTQGYLILPLTYLYRYTSKNVSFHAASRKYL